MFYAMLALSSDLLYSSYHLHMGCYGFGSALLTVAVQANQQMAAECCQTDGAETLALSWLATAGPCSWKEG